MSYGITTAGFVRKPRSVILAELEAAARVQFGADVDLSPGSPIGLMLGIFADELDAQWQLAEDVYYGNYIDTAEGSNLDRVAALGGIARNPAAQSAVELEVFGTATTVVPVGMLAQTATGVQFITTQAATIAAVAGYQEVDSSPVVFNGITVPGVATNTYDLDVTIDGGVLNQLSFSINVTDDWDTIFQSIESALQTATGSTETVVIIDGRMRITSATTGASSAVLIAAGTAGSGGGDILAYIDASIANMTTTIIAAVAGSAGRADIPARAVIAGVAGNVAANTINQLASSPAGVDSVNNRAEATGGSAIETDAELRTRYKQRGAAGGSSAVAIQTALGELDGVIAAAVFENNTDVAVGALSPHSINPVVEGGTTEGIAGVLLRFKPAGIETIGAITGEIVDNAGITRSFKWDVPTPIDIWVDVDITSNADWDSSFEATVKAKVAEIVGGTSGGISYAGLGIGVDVKSWRIIANFDDILGIDSVVVKVGLAASPANDVETIDNDERSRTDDAKIVITVI
jgi:uncharacterized phage protein gp47/JayE